MDEGGGSSDPKIPPETNIVNDTESLNEFDSTRTPFKVDEIMISDDENDRTRNTPPENHPQSHSTSSKQMTPRVKTYPENTSVTGPWVVFFRPKPKGKHLNIIQISKDLAKWTSVTEITKVRPNKLRVVVSSLKAANEIVVSQLFSLEYRVYIPSRIVEIEGVVTDMSLTEEVIKRYGVGRFKNLPSTNVKILDCRQLMAATLENGVKKYSPSASYRVTFEGTALPHYVVIDELLRLPVRLFVPRPMNCQNCKTVGHTASYCCNKTRCSRCGENHAEGACQAAEPKCVYCGGAPHDLSTCEVFKSCWDKQKRSLKERSKRSYAAILKSASPPAQSQQEQHPQTSNVFAVLPVDEVDTDTADEGRPFVSARVLRKRKNATSPIIQRKIPAVNPSPSSSAPIAMDKARQVPPGLRGNSSNQNVPAIAGTSKTPNVPISQSVSTSQPGLFKLSDIVDGIFTFFNVPDSIRSMVTAMLPIVKTLLQQLMQTWPLLAVFISLDV